MKTVIYILLLLIFSPKLLGQEWRDTLREARNSYSKQDYEKSFRLYRSAKKLAPREIDLSDEVAQSAYKAGKYEDAARIYSQSSSIKGSAVERGTTHRQIGNAYMKQQKYAEAIESYKQSLRSNPSDEYARYNLAQAMRKQKAQQDQKAQDQKDKKKNEQGNQDQKKNPDQKNQDQPEQKKDDQQKQQSENQPSENKPQPSDQKKQQGNTEQNASGEKRNKLSDKKTERMLDKLMKQEMETKRKFEGVKSTGNPKKSGKDW